MKRMCLVALLLLLFPVLASAEMVSISELREQAGAMGGRWQKTYETPNGALEVDIPIVIPDAETCPVLTVERAKPLTQEQFETIVAGKRSGGKEDPRFEIEKDGAAWEFFLGSVHGGGTDRYEDVSSVSIQLGGYRFSVKGGSMGYATPRTLHYPWEIDAEKPAARGTEQTLQEAMKVWQEHIDAYYPDGDYVVAPKRIYVYGSELAENTGTDKAAKQRGYYEIVGEQLIGGIPLFGAITSSDSENNYSVFHASTPETNAIDDSLVPYCKGATWACFNYLRMMATDGENLRTINELDRVRTVEYADVPLAPLDVVIAGIEKEIEAGRIKDVFSLRLGYLLYSNPDMTDYAWAVPRWVLDCHYVTAENEKSIEAAHEYDIDNELNVWNTPEFLQMPIDAQSGKPIIFTTGDEETFAVPTIVTWEKME